MIDAYRARGWVPVPLVGKKPFEANFLSRTVESTWPSGDYNVGLLLGAASGGLLDVDLDCPEAVALAPALLPSTLGFSRGPDSGHLFFSCVAIDKREAYSESDGGMIVEIRSGGGQTMVPPSVHPDTRQALEWTHPWREPLVIDAADLRRRVGWVAALSLVARHWPRGGRHEAQLALAGTLLTEGWTEEEALEALCAVCRIAGDEDRPKRDSTIRRTAERVANCEETTGWGTLAACLPPEVAKVARGWMGQKRRETIDHKRLEQLATVLTRSTRLDRKADGELLRRVLKMERITDDLSGVAKVIGATYPEADVGSIERAFAASTDSNLRSAIERGQKEALQRAAVAFERGDGTELARRTRAVLSRKGELVFDDGRLWRCEEGLWRAVSDDEVDGIVMSFAGAPVKGDQGLRVGANDVKAVRQTLLPSLCARTGWFAGAPPGIAFAGTFVGATSEEPLKGAHRCRAAYAWPWDPAATCDAWRGFLLSTYADPAVPEFLAEFAGACLLGVASSFQKAVVLFGDGGTGKSVVVRVLTGIMPEGSTASIAPHAWAREYSRARFVGVRLNSVSEMPATELMDSESVKAIISGDGVEAREPYGKPFDLFSTAGHLFAANELPPVRDMSMGFWRRFVTITHDNRPEVMVPGLAELLLAREGAGIVAWAVAGGRRALARKAYALPKDTASEQWRIESDSVAMWVRDRTVPGGPTPTADLYSDYRYHTIESGQKPVSALVFSRRLGRLASAHQSAHRDLKPVSMGPKEGRVRGWTLSILNTR